MPDLLAGSIVYAADTPPTGSARNDNSSTTTSTTYTTAVTSGSATKVGIAFIAPTTGRVRLDWSADITCTSTELVFLVPTIRLGSTIDAGTVVRAGGDNDALYQQGTLRSNSGISLLIDSLTPGVTYNATLQHRVTAGTGTLLQRRISVEAVS